jgi:hypothetical protein
VSKTSQLDASVNARGGSLTIPESNNQAVFAKNDNPGLQQTGLGVPGTGQGQSSKPDSKGLHSFFTGDQIKQVLDKSGGDQGKSGHKLLSSVPTENYKENPPADSSDTGIQILHAIYEELTAGNMYNPYGPDSSFIKRAWSGTATDLASESQASRGLFTVQRNLGSFDKNKAPVTTEQLSQRVISMLGTSPTAESPYKASEATMIDLLTPEQASELSGLYPWKLQAGTKSPPLQDWSRSRIFSSENYAGNVTSELPQAAGFLDLASQCYLQLLSAANSIKSELQAIKKNRFVALNSKQAGITTLFLSTNHDTSLLTYGQRESRRYWEIKDRDLRGAKDPSIDFEFERCFFRGVSLFFGLETSESGLNLSSLATSPIFFDSSGYYISLFRSLTVPLPFQGRSRQETNPSEEFKNLAKDRRSKIYKFVMVLVALGDVSFKSEIGMRDVTPTERMLTKNATRWVSPSVLALSTVAASNLESGNENKTVITAVGGALLGTFRNNVSRWSSIGAYDSAPSANPLSLHTFYAASRTPPGVGSPTTTPIGMRGMTPSRNNVELIENAMEAEYMPFYIHDLRTHEIFSMPAFITTFSEQFAATYNSATGFGRQDPVRIYQSTERSVTFSFILAAFSEEDFDHMWLLVNKIVAMCYPQYSAGRVRGDPSEIGGAFIQPFSQVPAASPMIRLRLGDVFKSNYSKFGLARLFGKNSTAWVKKDATSPTENINELVDSAASLSKNIKTAAALTAAKVVPNALSLAYAETSAGSLAANTLYDEGSNSQRVSNYVSNRQAEQLGQAVQVGVDTSIGVQNTADSLPKNQYPTEDFFSAKSNSVVRSFETTRGRGVAGFITSLGLDYEGSTWETKLGKKAPKMVKISLGFAPINDLPLGLDYDGYMRNPSHPVGRFAGSFGDVYSDIKQNTLNDKISVDDFNKTSLKKNIYNGQAAADVLLDSAFALDDNVGEKP